MQLTLPELDQPEGRLLIEQGQLAGQAYRVGVDVCSNPVCECGELALICFRESAGTMVGVSLPLVLELDLQRRLVVRPGASETGLAAASAKAVIHEMNPEHWDRLWTYFYAAKLYFTERVDLEELDTHFPADANDGAMVPYQEILPYARPLAFTAGGREWVVDDQYCLLPDCPCRAADLQCIPIGPLPREVGATAPNPYLRYKYDTQEIETEEPSTVAISGPAFLEAIRKVQPDFDAFLAKRHEQLRHLYRLFLKRHPESAWPEVAEEADAAALPDGSTLTPIRVQAKPGRNDPCPCGSGKKYKKCCGKG